VVADMKKAEEAFDRLIKERHPYTKKAQAQREKDKKIAFNTIRDHLEEWWD